MKLIFSFVFMILFSACAKQQHLVDLSKLPIHTLEIESITPIEQIENFQEIEKSLAMVETSIKSMGPQSYPNAWRVSYDYREDMHVTLGCYQNIELLLIPFVYPGYASGVEFKTSLYFSKGEYGHQTRTLFAETTTISGRFSDEWCGFSAILQEGTMFLITTNKAIYVYDINNDKWEKRFQSPDSIQVPLQSYDKSIIFGNSCEYGEADKCLLSNLDIFYFDGEWNENPRHFQIIDDEYIRKLYFLGISPNLKYAYVRDGKKDYIAKLKTHTTKE
ncbi:hypothetical protein CCZ01_00035 [Helicobacter monodelphidis]|uniref:hypothetical protein n=1 Tax=Helicobacter sp. 15-1451 TaxID=2004995 RepID=UPI000DCEA470|nr:hypothetical protein [Helicobacter sp. 15-1451]RAX59175.1 hypothetical protein CCZ01_00035 [Helicobacter sp. 15-1451]